jgi:hypothetical protein
MAETGSPAYPHIRSFSSCLAAARSACPTAGLSLAGLVGVADVTTTRAAASKTTTALRAE